MVRARTKQKAMPISAAPASRLPKPGRTTQEKGAPCLERLFKRRSAVPNQQFPFFACPGGQNPPPPPPRCGSTITAPSGCTRHSPQATKPSRSGHREFSCHTRRVQGGRSVLPFLKQGSSTGYRPYWPWVVSARSGYICLARHMCPNVICLALPRKPRQQKPPSHGLGGFSLPCFTAFCRNLVGGIESNQRPPRCQRGALTS